MCIDNGRRSLDLEHRYQIKFMHELTAISVIKVKYVHENVLIQSIQTYTMKTPNYLLTRRRIIFILLLLLGIALVRYKVHQVTKSNSYSAKISKGL